jgi:hypothetical protein
VIVVDVTVPKGCAERDPQPAQWRLRHRVDVHRKLFGHFDRGCFVVKDANRQALAYMYFEKGPLRRYRRRELSL